MVNSLNTMMMQGVLGKDMDWKARAGFGTCTNLQKTYQRKNRREEKNEKNGRAPVFWQAEMYTKHTKSDTKKGDGGTHTTHKTSIKPITMVRRDDRGPWSMNFNPPSKKRGKDGRNGEDDKDNDGNNRGPPKVVNTDTSSSQSQTSSIGIGEFGMRAAKQGQAATFSWAVKLLLFKHVKFLQGPDASLDFNMDETSICGFMRIQCGVSESDALQWWGEHRTSLRNHLTESRNNKIKMIKQYFSGKWR